MDVLEPRPIPQQVITSLQATLWQAQADELTAARLAEVLARYKPYLKHASQYRVGMEVMEIPGKDWTEIVRAVIKRITIQKDGRPRIEGFIPTKSAKARSSASKLGTPLCWAAKLLQLQTHGIVVCT